MFSKNLDFIMNLTNTQASALGAACHLDPSHVSRLRSGTRPLPKNPGFLRGMSEYLAKRITTDYQKKAVCGALSIEALPESTESLTALIESWLVKDERSAEQPSDISFLIESFTKNPPENSSEQENTLPLSDRKSCYYGTQGKREAVLHFLDMVIKEKEPQTLLLFSDEDTDWLFGDEIFAAKWLQSFTKVLTAGNRVKIIHSIGRKMNEMLEAVSKWLPAYKTGMIEPYYYPKLRDGVYQRTLFIAPKTAAIAASSVDNKTDGMLNMLITEKEAVNALTLEFDRYFSLCRPLMHIFTQKSSPDLWEAYDALIFSNGSAVCMSDTPTLLTMPLWVARSMQKRAPESFILERHKALSEFVKKLSESKNSGYTEILPEKFDISSPPPLPCAELFGAKGLCYTKEEWTAHLESSFAFSEFNRGYTQLRRKKIPSGITFLAKEERGVIMTVNTKPCTAFAFSEEKLVNSLWSYLSKNI